MMERPSQYGTSRDVEAQVFDAQSWESVMRPKIIELTEGIHPDSPPRMPLKKCSIWEAIQGYTGETCLKVLSLT